LLVIGEVPELMGSSWLAVVNHNHRPWFLAWWMPLTITAVMGREIHWIMTSTWRTVAGSSNPWLVRLSTILLRRAARMYGFTSMPPMPPRPAEAQARASAVRRVLRHIDSSQETIVGLAPEGRDNPAGVLIPPPAGVGRFACQLARRNLRLLPTGMFEADGRLCLQIGAPLDLPKIEGSPARRDQRMSDLLMQAIARCVPERMRGPYL
jgi:hypothetical protein